MNPFVHKSAAKRYALSRPRIHKTALQAFLKATNQKGAFGVVLDVACGTGHSTVALKEMARLPIGVDISVPMLSVAEKAAGVHYSCGTAESLPFAAASFELISVGLGFHWFEQAQFLAEAARLLQDHGWLLIYNSWISGEMVGSADFGEKALRPYFDQFPAPPRGPRFPDSEAASLVGLGLENVAEFEDWISFTVAELVDYLCTQSNVIAAVDAGGVSLAEIQTQIRALIAPFFQEDRPKFRFPGQIVCLQKLLTPLVDSW